MTGGNIRVTRTAPGNALYTERAVVSATTARSGIPWESPLLRHELGLLGGGLPRLRRRDPPAQRDLLDEQGQQEDQYRGRQGPDEHALHRVRDREEHVVLDRRRQ